jgi:hypothetical protein
MYVQDGGFQPLKVEGLLSHFLVLHWIDEEDPDTEDWLFRGHSYL